MIKLPKNFLLNLSPAQYKDQLKLLPKLKDQKTQLYIMVGFTLAALSIFGIFAINPTLSTIIELKREFADLQFVKQQLMAKIQNLSNLQQSYQSLTGDLPFVLNALPQKAEIPQFIAQVNAELSNSNLKVITLRTYGVEITPDKKVDSQSAESFIFSLEAQGSYDDIMAFVHNITRINRLITIESVSISKDDKSSALMLNLRARQYFKP